jgi:hypothetical protein
MKIRRTVYEANGTPVVEEWDIKEMSYPPIAM